MLPERYKEVLDFFEGLHIAGEMLGENIVKFKRQKAKSSLQVLTKTSIGNTQGYADRRQWFFKEEKFEKDQKFFFSFTVTFERKIDEILIHAFLPSIGEGSMVLRRDNAIKRMYENGFIVDLFKDGFKDATINDVTGQGFELFAKAGPSVSYERISDLYNQVKLMNTKAFNAVGMQL